MTKNIKHTVFIVDPSFFTLPYDIFLFRSLGERGGEVSLIGRKIRRVEQLELRPTDQVTQFFYGVSESLFRNKRGKVFQLVKFAEHCIDMLAFIMLVILKKPDIVHFQWLPVPLFDAYVIKVLRYFTKVVLTVHDTNPFHGSSPSKLQLLGANKLYSVCDAYIVHTNFSKSELQGRGVPQDKISVIHHGVLHFKEAEKASCDERFPSKKLFLLFGEVKPYKNVELLMKAVNYLDEKVAGEVVFLVAGISKMPTKKLVEMAAESKYPESIVFDFRFIPEDEVYCLFRESYGFLLPYTEIDSSGVLMYSIAFGKQIIASDVGGFSEILADGVDSLLINPNDARELAASIEESVLEREEAIARSEALISKSKTIYSWKEISGRTVEVYDEIINKLPVQ